MVDLANRIVEAKDLKNKPLGAIPEWGIEAGELFLKGFSGRDRANLEESRNKLFEEVGEKVFDAEWRALFLTHILVDKEGKRIFADGGRAVLLEKNAHVVERLFFEGAQWTGYLEDAIEEAAKNSESDPSSEAGSN